MGRALALATLVLCATAGTARAQTGTIQGFGGVTFGTSSILGEVTPAPSLGGVVTASLTPNIHAVGEIGRLSNMQPSVYDLLEFTRAEFNLSAWYYEGGVRFIASPAAVRPYAEATAGIARLHPRLTGFGDRFDPFINAGLNFMITNEPLLGGGVGVLLERGALSVDLGYRYKKITAGGFASTINSGNPYQINEARLGVGFRF